MWVIIGLLLGAFGSLWEKAVWAAEWTPLISSASFTGIQTDTLTAVAGIMSVSLIIVGLGILLRMFTR
jgi:hypothetical protein